MFMQWQQMDFPLLHDPFNLLNLPDVPVTLLLDEHGVIRLNNPNLNRLADIETQVLDRAFVRPADLPDTHTAAPDMAILKAATEPGRAIDWLTYADALALWGGPERLDEAIAAAQQALRRQPDGKTHFHLGVLHRWRYDSAYGQPDDFRQAVEHWAAALRFDPNNYIWRRRIQQYGPRLDKPYAFYDWVREARADLRGRGEEPLPLAVEPGGAEYAYPVESFGVGDPARIGPDPEGRITRDTQQVSIETAVVPPTIRPGDSARLHLTLRVQARTRWNNKGQEIMLWLELPTGWEAESRLLRLPNPAAPVSAEPRRFEVEVCSPGDSVPGPVTLSAYVLYTICENISGVCLYRRQDLVFHLTVQPADAPGLRDGR